MALTNEEDMSWTSVPTHLLLAELERRHGTGSNADTEKPACGSGDRGEYNTPLHVFALFLILALSVLACGFPLFSRQSAKSRRANTIVFLCQHFGTGVLIATAFVHLLPTAFLSLTDPCLPPLFSENYQPMAGLVAMASVLVVVAVESYLTTRGAGHSHSHNHSWDSDDEGGELENNVAQVNGSLAAKRVSSHRPTDIALGDVSASQGLMADVSPLPESTPTIVTTSPNRMQRFIHNGEDREDDIIDDEDLDLNLNELDPAGDDDSQPLAYANGNRLPKRNSESAIAHAPLTPEEQKRRMLQCMLLEAGILFHSIFIGMAVSVATGPPFVVFLVAIAFHQTFEGLALGSRIAAIQFPRNSARPWLMVLAYGLTTPIGQAIGLAVHRLYDPLSQTGLLMVGFMNAISSGLLLFAGLVQLLAEDFLTESSYKSLKGKKRRNAGIAVLAGATLMAIVGAFA
ncbi:hypothetical protein M426DRAFT_188579 [Hypoxylon sp. CI-4A]|nr:hypothetical protein M426DRAFT_188579 [Hypoxylon sp. CI-4A]